MPLARKPSKASFPRAMQATVRRFKARLQARQDKAASTSRLGCKYIETGLQARPMGKRSFPHPRREHAVQVRAARSISHRSTLHRPSHRPAFSHRMRSGRQALSPTLFPTTASAAGGKWCESEGKPLPVPAKSSTFAHTERYKRKKTDDKQSTHKTDSCSGNAQAPAARGTLCGRGAATGQRDAALGGSCLPGCHSRMAGCQLRRI